MASPVVTFADLESRIAHVGRLTEQHVAAHIRLRRNVGPLLTACRALIAAHDAGANRTRAIEEVRTALAAFTP